VEIEGFQKVFSTQPAKDSLKERLTKVEIIQKKQFRGNSQETVKPKEVIPNQKTSLWLTSYKCVQ
jgi:hypothetical protein